MLDNTMTEDQLNEQAARYQGHRFLTCRQTPIRIDETLTLRAALENLAVSLKMQVEAEYEASISSAIAPNTPSYEELTNKCRRLQEVVDDDRAQAMVAMYRETGFWPSQFYNLGLR